MATTFVFFPARLVAATFEGLACSNRRHHRGGDQRADAGNAHQAPAIRFILTDLLDLAADGLDALVEPEPVLIEPHDQIVHPGGEPILAVLQYREQ